MANPIPIKFSFAPVPTAIKAANINDLLGIVAKYIQGSISANATFIQSGSSDPVSDVGVFYNTASDVWKYWDASFGKYMPISENQIGDTKATYTPGDDINRGWIALDGRPIDAIDGSGFTNEQKSVLQTLFPSGSLPNYTFVGGLNGLPDAGAFSGITNPTVTPVNDVIGSLQFSSAYNYDEEKALRDNTETLRDSADSTQKALTSVITQSEAVLGVLRGAATTTSMPTIKVFVGYP